MRPINYLVLLFAFFVVAESGWTQQSRADGFERQKQGFDQQVANLERAINALKTKYVTQLRNLGAQRARVGDVDGSLAVRDELEGLKEGISEIPDSFAELKRLRQLYDRELDFLNKNRARRLYPMAVDYRGKLKLMHEAVVRSGDEALANLVGDESERIDQLLAEITPLVDEATLAATGPDEGSILFEDNFDSEELDRGWTVDGVMLEGGRMIARQNGSSMEFVDSFEGNIRVEMDLEKEGGEDQSEWDFVIEFLANETVGVLRFDYDDIDAVYLQNASENSSETTRGRDPNKGTLSLSYRRGRVRLEFENSRRTISTDWVDVPEFAETRIRLHLAGIDTSPRIVDAVRVLRLD